MTKINTNSTKVFVLNPDDKDEIYKTLLPYAGKVLFDENDNGICHIMQAGDVYNCKWEKIWNILLRQKMEARDRPKIYGSVGYGEMERVMFDTLRTLYNAPLIKVSYDFESEKQAKDAFILKSFHCFDYSSKKEKPKYNLYLVDNMTYFVHGVGFWKLLWDTPEQDLSILNGYKLYLK